MAGLSFAGGLLPILTTAVSTFEKIDDIFEQRDAADDRADAIRHNQQTALSQLKQRQERDFAERRVAAEEKRAEIDTKSDQANAQRQAALKRAVARRKADFGARGVSADAGSGEAVLLGLFDETEEEAKKRRELDNLRKNALASDLDNLNKRNLLEVSQLRERQRLNRMLF
jgi:hypothetical protein